MSTIPDISGIQDLPSISSTIMGDGTFKQFRIPKAILETWLAALRSGEYKQATSFLEAPVTGSWTAEVNTSIKGYCCLGVLQMAVDGDVQRDDSGSPLGLPTLGWYHDHGIIPTEMLEKPTWNRDSQYSLNSNKFSLAYLNDALKLKFEEIANHIERIAEPY
jgi:hypothetical protein